jgi:hypothetical protein
MMQAAGDRGAATAETEGQSMLKKIGFGIVLWAVPFVVAIPLFPLMQSDPTFFKTIMIVVGAATGAVLAARYFVRVEGDFLRASVLLAVVWIALSWILDFAVLLPLSGMAPGRYFIEIGLRYLAIVAPAVALGYVLHARSGR